MYLFIQLLFIYLLYCYIIIVLYNIFILKQYFVTSNILIYLFSYLFTMLLLYFYFKIILITSCIEINFFLCCEVRRTILDTVLYQIKYIVINNVL